MKRQLTLLVLAVTSLVVVAFTLPLAALVQRDADAEARRRAEGLAQSVATTVVRIAATDGVATLTVGEPSLPAGIGLVFPTGLTTGEVTQDGLSLASEASSQQRAVSAYTEDGWEVAIPVLTRDGTVVVTASVPNSELRAGVTRAWMLLAALGVTLIGVSLLLAGRLGRRLTRTVAELGSAARQLAAGDLSTRIHVDDPPELASVAEAFNDMAPRLEALIEEEREEVADLSHRLRTPLARLRLQAERVDSDTIRQALLADLDRADRTVDEIIEEARSRPDRAAIGIQDIGQFVRDRAAFWQVLAEEENRPFTIAVSVEPGVAVRPSEKDLTAALDAVLGNVFDHTPPGTAFQIRCEPWEDSVVVAVDDAGSGLPNGIDALARGVSGAGSTGLGLDIARRTAERGGGTLRTGQSRLGGASVALVMGVISPRARG
ncbi:MAG: HAMP domain-containing protein [Acidimicrobiia bacterium]